jgi:hypothetical protein
MVGIAAGFVILIGFLVPAQFAQAFGLANHYTAVVQNVALSADQPSNGSVRRNGSKWDVQVRWNDQGTNRLGSGIARGDNQPYQVGDQVDIATAGDGTEVSLNSTGAAWAVLATVVGLSALFVAVAGYYWHRSRAWRPLPTLVTTSKPKRVQVQGTPVRHRRRNSRVDVLERGHLIEYEAVDGNEDVGSFLLLRAEHGQVPEAMNELDLWSVDIQGPPFAVRRPSDGLWWLGSDRS